MRIAELLRSYRAGTLDPSEVAADVLKACDDSRQPVWISRVCAEESLAKAAALDEGDRSLPLYGIPFAVKDNIDVAGLATTAGCPGFARVAEQTAPVVQRLLDAGALLVGKTNMDQFATGLVGTRSPYGACTSVFSSDHISGGSSSGSAVAVALGHVAFSLGTDTAGSGRVPAAFNSLVGVKPTRGLLSTRGVVPACASIDCVSIFTRDVSDAALVLEVAAGFDEQDPWSRRSQASSSPRTGRVGIPRSGQIALSDPLQRGAWEAALARAADCWDVVEVDVSALLDAAPLLYAAWIAERAADLGGVVASVPAGLDQTVAAIITAGGERTGPEVFGAMHELAALRRAAEPVWEGIDALLLPTTATHPTLADVARDPIGVNEQLGQFTNFVNLMDLSAVAIPGPAREDDLPFGVTLMAPAFGDARLLELTAGWTGEHVSVPLTGTVHLAVAGAHLSGLPLNHQLTSRGARLVRATATAGCYRLYALPGEGVPRPGVIRVAEGGAALDVEVWELSPEALGELMTLVPAPLGIGRLVLADGEEVQGFICEGHAVATATDVTAHGGWRAYLGSLAEVPV